MTTPDPVAAARTPVLKRCACNPLQDHLCVLDHVDSVAAAHAWRLKWNHLNEQIMDVMERDVAQAIAAHTAQAVAERDAARISRDAVYDELCRIRAAFTSGNNSAIDAHTAGSLFAKVAQQAEEIARLRAALEWIEQHADHGPVFARDAARAALRASAPAEGRPEPEDRPNANGMFEPGLA